MKQNSDLLIQYGLRNIEAAKRKGFVVGMIFRASFGFGMVVYIMSVLYISGGAELDSAKIIFGLTVSTTVLITFILFYWVIFNLYKEKSVVSSIKAMQNVLSKNSIESIDYIEISNDYHMDVISGFTLSALHKNEPLVWWAAFIAVELVTYWAYLPGYFGFLFQ